MLQLVIGKGKPRKVHINLFPLIAVKRRKNAEYIRPLVHPAFNSVRKSNNRHERSEKKGRKITIFSNSSCNRKEILSLVSATK